MHRISRCIFERIFLIKIRNSPSFKATVGNTVSALVPLISVTNNTKPKHVNKCMNVCVIRLCKYPRPYLVNEKHILSKQPITVILYSIASFGLFMNFSAALCFSLLFCVVGSSVVVDTPVATLQLLLFFFSRIYRSAVSVSVL